jgi:membrane-bound ClpP family serine protease
MSTALRSPFARYVLLEIPGWLIASVLLALFVRAGRVEAGTAAILLALWIAKDFALYPVLRVGYLPSAPDGTGSLVGALGTARGPLDPEGWVRVGSELWRAEVAREHAPVESGATVRIVAVDRLTLRVERA